MPPIRVGEPWQGQHHTELLLRPYDGSQSDLDALTRVRNATLRATSRPEEFRDVSPEELGRYYDGGGFQLEGNAWLMLLGTEPVAAAILYPMAAFDDSPPGNFHLYVVPQLWRHGIGSRLLDHLEQAAVGRGYPVLETTVAREDDKSTRFLLNHGFSAVGHTIHLARFSLDNLPNVDLADGFAIRSLAELQESPELYRQTANRLGAYDLNYSLITPDTLEQQVAVGRWDPAGALLLFDPTGRIVGVIRTSRLDERTGYLNEIGLEPASRGKGLGAAMLATALRYLASIGVERAELDTPSENAAAHNLALRAGFEETRHWLHYLKRLEVGDRASGIGDQEPKISKEAK